MEEFLDAIPCDVMDRLIAYDNAHGIGLDRLITVVRNGFVRLAAAWSDSKSFDVDDENRALDPWLRK